jgi:hypothetical protein
MNWVPTPFGHDAIAANYDERNFAKHEPRQDVLGGVASSKMSTV